ncbi:MAG: coproporphyrinogen dehydrogenase HemZ, partial [Clostridia bacterium]|nr:coproporphyrinogen dehydrogenase HemZ [Clostridia bacterium]
MFDYINTPWLEADIMDIIRLFDAENERFGHYFEYSKGNFDNHIEYSGEIYDFSDYAEPADDVEFKRYARRFAKLAYYKLLSEKKGIKHPYGALTGVRPTKLAYMELAVGREFEQLFKSLGVSDENVKHVAKVIETQRQIYNDGGGQDLFISLPFCPTKCEYCSFITAPVSVTKHLIDPYISCVERELRAIKPLLTRIKSIYIGGGTPFAVDENQIERILCAVQALNLPNCEYTVEAGRPDTFTDEKLALCKKYGVNRICVNPQSFNDATLEKIGRRHTAAQTVEAYEMAKGYGFDINIDLIAGLADETAADFEYSLKRAIELDPENITVHTLSLKAGAKLKEKCNRLQIEGIGEMIALSRKYLTEAGYAPYYMYRQKYQAGGHENCGWCKTGKASVYNVDVMEEIADNVAVG